MQIGKWRRSREALSNKFIKIRSMVSRATLTEVCSAFWDHTPSSPPSPVLHHAQPQVGLTSLRCFPISLGSLVESSRFSLQSSRFSSNLQDFSSNLQDFSSNLQDFSSNLPSFQKLAFITMTEEHQEAVYSEEGPVPVLKWDLGLFEQIVQSFRFPPEWDARYPAQGQTAADAPPGYITLYEDFFLQGNFRLPATNFMGSILHHYNFHLSQMSPPGMVRVRHFEFLCRSHGIGPTVEKFRAFYQLQRTMGFFSFASRGAAKKILLNPPKSFHDWKPKFFFIREEVLPIAMPFRDWTEAVLKEDLPIPKNARWYQQLTPTPNRVFGENVLVAARMSDQWSPDSKEVPVLKIGDQEAHLYQAAFATFGGSMGVRPLREDEESWYEQIRGNFMYPVADAFATPPTTTEGAQFAKPRPLRSVTSAREEVVYLSSEESVGSSNGELSSWSNIFAGVLRDLGIDPEEKKKKPSKKKKIVNLDLEVTSKGAGTSRATTVAAGKEEEVEEEKDAAAQLVGRKRGRSETTAGVVSAPNVGLIPLVGKTSNLRSLYKFSPGKFLISLPFSYAPYLNYFVLFLAEIKKKTPEKGVKFTEPEPKRPKITIKSSQTTFVDAAKEKNIVEQDAAKAVEAQREEEKKKKAEEDKRKKAEERKKKVEEERRKKFEEEMRKKAEEEKKAEEAKKKEEEQKKAMDKPVNVQGPEVAKPTHPARAETHDRSRIITSKGSGRYTSSGASSGGAGGYNPNSYTEEERGDAPHQAHWSLKQKDTFQEFAPCRDWFLNSFTPGEVNRQRGKNHELLYRTYVIGEANTRAANHQIVREWRTMSKAAFDEEKAKFDADKKAEEWGREGLKNKLQAAEQQLAKEKAEFKRICERDNERAFAARNKIVDLEAKIAELTTKVEEAQVEKVAKQQMELAETKVQLSSKDGDLHAKDVEIAELKRRLNEQIDKCESLEIDLEAEKVKAATAEEARVVSTAALNVAQTNYSEAQGIVDTLVSEAEWMRTRGVVLVANSILNVGELDRAVAALTDAARAVGHRGGYLECAQHAEEMLGQEFDVSHCSVTDQASAALTSVEGAYDNLNLPVMDLVVEALKKDDWCQRLKAILDPPVTVELSDEEPAGDDGGDGDDDGNDDDGDDDGDQHNELE
ncbi:hypothetical protein Hanom_Chr04g00341171 [Helianthus anomalus]